MKLVIKPCDIEEAYRKTGYRPVSDNWFANDDYASALVVLLLSKGCAFKNALDLSVKLHLSIDFIRGFIVGFDTQDNAIIVNHLGYFNGLAVRQHLLNSGWDILRTSEIKTSFK